MKNQVLSFYYQLKLATAKCYDKTIKTTISFYICLFLLKKKKKIKITTTSSHTHTHTLTYTFNKNKRQIEQLFFKRANHNKLTKIKPHTNQLNLNLIHIQHSTRTQIQTPTRKPSNKHRCC